MKFVHPSGSRPLDGYTIKRGIGIGGFGEVYFATSDGGKEVALKRIQRNLEIELRGVRQCLNLKHPNLVNLFDIKHDDGGEGWVVMEYVAGESLKELLDRNPQGLPEQEAVELFRGLVAGVEYLHDHGIVHRDLKPGNIYLDEGMVKIGDYGLSKFISCSRRSGQTESVGTFHYMAPEIGKGVYGKEIDIYALGIILHELLTGRVPFDGESRQEIIMKHLTADPDLGNVRQPYRRVIARALHKDPQQRFASATEMLSHLRAPQANQANQANAEAGEPGFAPAGFAGPLLSDPVVAHAAVPPVVRGTAAEGEVLYIGDDSPPAGENGIVFGPLRERPVPPTASSQPAGNQPPVVGRRRGRAAGPAAAGGEEPVARAVTSFCGRCSEQWHALGLSAPMKLILLACLGIVALINVEWLVPLAVLLGAVYLVYFGIRTLVLMASEPGTASHNAPRSGRGTLRMHRHDDRLLACRLWDQQPHTHHLGDFTGSLLFAALASGALWLLTLALLESPWSEPSTWARFAWGTLTSVIGCWALLIAGRWWARSPGDALQRRIGLITLGLLVGAASFAVALFLGVDLPEDSRFVLVGRHETLAPSSWYQGEIPSVAAFLVYFAGLFGALRWWRQVDPLRRARLGLFGLAVVGVVAWVLHALVYFPQPWAPVAALITSLAAQLAAPWMTPAQRQQARELAA